MQLTGQTRYAAVNRMLVREIAGGVFPPGSTLPPELELATRFGVSRSTVRLALAELERGGMVRRRRGTGTEVVAAAPVNERSNWAQNLGTVDAVVQYAERTSRRIMAVAPVVADDALRDRIGGRAGQRWLHIASMRLERDDPDAPPICWTDTYVEAQFANGVIDAIHDHEGAICLLVERFTGRPIVEIEQSIRARTTPDDLAESLRVAPGSPCLEIVRRYLLTSGQVTNVSISIHPADRFTYQNRLTRG